jgi:hypothetical protein
VPQLTVANGPDDESLTGLIPGPSISHEMVDVSDPSDDWTDTFTDEGLSTRTVDQGNGTSFTCDSLAPSTTVSEACPVPVTWMPTPFGGTVRAAVVGVGGSVDDGVGGGNVVDGGLVVEGVPAVAAPTAEDGRPAVVASDPEVLTPDGFAAGPDAPSVAGAVGLALPSTAVTTTASTTPLAATHQYRRSERCPSAPAPNSESARSGPNGPPGAAGSSSTADTPARSSQCRGHPRGPALGQVENVWSPPYVVP